jgi:hypothetical protein
MKFFNNMNWNDLYEMKIKPPYKPDLRNYRNNLESCNYPFEEVINVNFLLSSLRKIKITTRRSMKEIIQIKNG